MYIHIPQYGRQTTHYNKSFRLVRVYDSTI